MEHPLYVALLNPGSRHWAARSELVPPLQDQAKTPRLKRSLSIILQTTPESYSHLCNEDLGETQLQGYMIVVLDRSRQIIPGGRADEPP